METLLPKRNEPADIETGLVVREKMIANSGFMYLTGERQFNNLKIMEGVSKGTASTFLLSLTVFDEHKSLIYDAEIKKMTNYSRETARKMVLEGLMQMLRESANLYNKKFDEVTTYAIINNQLKTAYYDKSYKSVIEWAKEIGIQMH
jgi:hypothetical protein